MLSGRGKHLCICGLILIAVLCMAVMPNALANPPASGYRVEDGEEGTWHIWYENGDRDSNEHGRNHLAGTRPDSCTICAGMQQSGHSHSYTWTVLEEPTCTTGGLGMWRCVTCNYFEYQMVRAPRGHTALTYKGTVDGAPVHGCANCSELDAQCSCDSWTVTSPATCTTAGEESSTCAVCGHNVSRQIEAKGHGAPVYKGETDGIAIHGCPDCTEIDEACTFGEWTVVRAATCTQPGEETRTCSVCGHVAAREIPMLGHTAPAYKGEKDGVPVHGCADCAQTDEACTFGAWEITKLPTCTESGLRTRTCTVCGFSQTGEIAPGGHMPLVYKDNSMHGCPNCSALDEDCTLSGWTTESKVTCTADGRQYRVCTGCGRRIEGVIKAKGHKYNTETRSDADGIYTHYECQNCNKAFDRGVAEIIPVITQEKYGAAELELKMMDSQGEELTTLRGKNITGRPGISIKCSHGVVQRVDNGRLLLEGVFYNAFDMEITYSDAKTDGEVKAELTKVALEDMPYTLRFASAYSNKIMVLCLGDYGLSLSDNAAVSYAGKSYRVSGGYITMRGSVMPDKLTISDYDGYLTAEVNVPVRSVQTHLYALNTLAQCSRDFVLPDVMPALLSMRKDMNDSFTVSRVIIAFKREGPSDDKDEEEIEVPVEIVVPPKDMEMKILVEDPLPEKMEILCIEDEQIFREVPDGAQKEEHKISEKVIGGGSSKKTIDIDGLIEKMNNSKDVFKNILLKNQQQLVLEIRTFK